MRRRPRLLCDELWTRARTAKNALVQAGARQIELDHGLPFADACRDLDQTQAQGVELATARASAWA